MQCLCLSSLKRKALHLGGSTSESSGSLAFLDEDIRIYKNLLERRESGRCFLNCPQRKQVTAVGTSSISSCSENFFFTFKGKIKMQVWPTCVSFPDVDGPLLFGVEFLILRCVWVRIYVEPPLAMWIKCRLHCLLALNPLKGLKTQSYGLSPQKKNA